jgi:aryl-alcohol dehydrogenase-like predicted oxidoreductase
MPPMYDGGVRYFDTAPFYGYGRSELRMGFALRQMPVISTCSQARSAASCTLWLPS